MRRRSKPVPVRAAPVAKPVEVEERVPLPEVPWRTRHHYGCQHTSLSVSQIVRGAMTGEFRLPKFQRPFVWSETDVLFLLDSLLRGYHVGSLFLWRREKLPASVQSFGGVEVDCAAGGSQLVIDGQQRIGSLVRAFVSGRFSFHLLEGTFHVDVEGPWLCPLTILINPSGLDNEVRLHNPASWDWAAEHAAKYGLEERVVRGLLWGAIDPVTRAQISTTYVDYHHSREEVVESFRRMNTAGRRFDEGELLDAMKRAEEEGATDGGDR